MKLSLERLEGRHPAAPSGAVPALAPLTLQIANGEQVAVIGPSGAGKTTLMQLLACARPPSAGRLLLDGIDPWTLPRPRLQHLRGQLFLAPQVPPLPPRQRVVTAVLAGCLPRWSFGKSLRSLVYPADIPAAEAALARLDLADKLFERVDRLSGGERQRVGLARALVSQARLLLVDEPLSALDPARALQAIATLTHAARDGGATLVATLHHVDMALAHFPRIVGLQAGRLAFDLPAAQVSPARLAELYGGESPREPLTGDAAEPPIGARPVAMTCR